MSDVFKMKVRARVLALSNPVAVPSSKETINPLQTLVEIATRGVDIAAHQLVRIEVSIVRSLSNTFALADLVD
jgi:endo-1,4-beta-mannosidase